MYGGGFGLGAGNPLMGGFNGGMPSMDPSVLSLMGGAGMMSNAGLGGPMGMSGAWLRRQGAVPPPQPNRPTALCTPWPLLQAWAAC